VESLWHFYLKNSSHLKKTDDKKWEVVKFFVENGFDYSTKIGGDVFIGYDETLEEAKEVVWKYKAQQIRK
jgi:hypothetical protein